VDIPCLSLQVGGWLADDGISLAWRCNPYFKGLALAMEEAALMGLAAMGQQINQSRLQLANITNDLFNVSTRLDPNAQEALDLQLRINAIQSLDKGLELQLRRVDTQHAAVQTEMDAVKKVIDKSVDQVFKTFA
jgi:hypothetical protein